MEKVLGSYHIFPFHRIKNGDDIIIWGFGEVGQKYYEQIKKTNYCQVLFVVDKNWKKFQHEEIKVYDTSKIKESNNVPVVIANTDVKVACQIREQLLKWNVKESLIIWDDLICETEIFAKLLDRKEVRYMEDSSKNSKRVDAAIKRVEELERQIKNSSSNRNMKMEGLLMNYVDIVNNFIMGISQNNVGDFNDVKKLILESKHPVIDCTVETLNKHYSILDIVFDNKLQSYSDMTESVFFDLACIWGSKPTYNKSKLMAIAIKRHIPIVFFEDGFVESITHGSEKNTEKVFRCMHSLTADVSGAFFMGGKSTLVERLLNSDRELNEGEIARARDLITKICTMQISKYNHQPDYLPEIGDRYKKKVLVIDQVWNDQSICDGMADDSVFSTILECAIAENPDADILIKTHPVSRLTNFPRHFENIHSQDNLYVIEESVNPISILKVVDKVYVCTSQMGFEALMLGKDVHVFGMPFYAGWGVTHDYMENPRRKKHRTVEEIFYMAYIECSIYVSYEKKKICEIEDAIDEILNIKKVWEINQRIAIDE